jgi:hypothetical protein
MTGFSQAAGVRSHGEEHIYFDLFDDVREKNSDKFIHIFS